MKVKVKYKTKKIKYNNEKQGFGGAAPNKVESYAKGVVSEHKVQMNHAIGMDITLLVLQGRGGWKYIHSSRCQTTHPSVHMDDFL